MRKAACLLFTVMTAVLSASPPNDAPTRIERSASVPRNLTSSSHGIPAEKLGASDCIAVVPGFKKGPPSWELASERDSSPAGLRMAAPGATTVETTDLGVLLGGEEIDLLDYGRTKGAFAGFGLDGAASKPDESGNKSLYGKTVTNHDIVETNLPVPEAAGPLVAAFPHQ